jgi:hypothetical protein
MDWDGDDGSHALVTGWVTAALSLRSGTIVADVSPVMDEQGNYTNVVRLTTVAGNVYDVTVTTNP